MRQCAGWCVPFQSVHAMACPCALCSVQGPVLLLEKRLEPVRPSPSSQPSFSSQLSVEVTIQQQLVPRHLCALTAQVKQKQLGLQLAHSRPTVCSSCPDTASVFTWQTLGMKAA